MQMANQNDGEHIIEIGDQRPSIPTIQTPSSSPSHSNPFESGLWISLQFILSVIQIVASIVVLSLSKLNGDPDYKLFSWVVGYACGCVLMLPLLYCRYIVRGTVNLQYVFVYHSSSFPFPERFLLNMRHVLKLSGPLISRARMHYLRD